ncbi:hypothetical protein GDO81_011119 [Engystomops pustulosus]|uniref:Uncharacterized protein n=1 Tax=Engystomops pustulosus TaxID=76066 RepID=A0AAV7BC65_ENGPU|nr:hypothetical protein GDO81_011119 [Engystomops pustulosus]
MYGGHASCGLLELPYRALCSARIYSSVSRGAAFTLNRITYTAERFWITDPRKTLPLDTRPPYIRSSLNTDPNHWENSHTAATANKTKFTLRRDKCADIGGQFQ